MHDPAHDLDSPSPWVRRWATLIRPGGRVLDLACGRGRHVRHLSALGFAVVAADRDEAALAGLQALPGVEARRIDLEASAWPFADASFDAVVVTNYLHRPLFGNLVASLRPHGILIYETFAAGNERYGRPSNPAFLLQPGELLGVLSGLTIVAFEQGKVAVPKAAVVQRVCAIRADAAGAGPIALEWMLP